MVKIEDTGERLIPELHYQSLTYGEHLARYKAALGLVKNKVVLDVASGAGYGSALLAEQAKKVIGIDYDPQAVNYAASLYKKGNLSFELANAEALPCADQSVDVVVSLETIEHLPHPEKFVQEVIRVLKPKGVFYVSTPNDDEYIEGNTFHLHEFRFKELHELMQKYFKHTHYYYQGTWYASGVLSEQNFTGNKPHNVPATKTFGQETHKAIYYLAVATNSNEVPPLEEMIIASDAFSARNSFIEHQKQEKEIHRIRSEISRLDTELSAILNSRGWKMLKKIYSVKSILKRS